MEDRERRGDQALGGKEVAHPAQTEGERDADEELEKEQEEPALGSVAPEHAVELVELVPERAARLHWNGDEHIVRLAGLPGLSLLARLAGLAGLAGFTGLAGLTGLAGRTRWLGGYLLGLGRLVDGSRRGCRLLRDWRRGRRELGRQRGAFRRR